MGQGGKEEGWAKGGRRRAGPRGEGGGLGQGGRRRAGRLRRYCDDPVPGTHSPVPVMTLYLLFKLY